MKKLILLLALPVMALAGTTSTTTDGPWVFKVGSRNAGEYPSKMACEAAAAAHAEGAKRSRTYRCVMTASVAVTYKANPSAQWALSDWGAWQTTMTGSCVVGKQLVRQVRTRTVVTAGAPPEPELSQSQDLQEDCMDMPGMGEKPIPAAPHPGFTKLMIGPTDDHGVPSDDGVGAFRIPCPYSHMAFDDPIVFPGQPGKSHLHTFFGNSSTDAFSTGESLLAANESTCAGGTANRTAYWVPAMVDETNHALVPTHALWYYKKGYNENPPASVTVIPNGLKIIAGGNPMAKGPRPIDEWKWDSHNYFSCQIGDTETERLEHIPNCPEGSTLNVVLSFPNCWDGVNLDSADHRSHMAYSGGGSCPATHPVVLPVLSLNIGYTVPATGTSKWRLSSDMYDHSLPGGYSMHGDVMFAWTPEVIAAFTQHCLRESRDGHAYLLCDGTALYD